MFYKPFTTSISGRIDSKSLLTAEETLLRYYNRHSLRVCDNARKKSDKRRLRIDTRCPANEATGIGGIGITTNSRFTDGVRKDS